MFGLFLLVLLLGGYVLLFALAKAAKRADELYLEESLLLPVRNQPGEEKQERPHLPSARRVVGSS
jgi:hypothetical protein